MGVVTLHLVIGVGVLIIPAFLLLFSYKGMSLATLYIMIGSLSFVTSVITTIVLVTKFINQPAAHGFFSYSDTIASALLSLGLLLDGVIAIYPASSLSTPCYQYKLVYGLFIVPIVTGFFSVLGMSIERFQAFAVYRDHRHVTRKFSIAWFMSSWTLAVCFVVILVAQINEVNDVDQAILSQKSEMDRQLLPRYNELASQLFPGPLSEPIPEEVYFNLKKQYSTTAAPIVEDQHSFLCSEVGHQVECDFEDSTTNSSATLSDEYIDDAITISANTSDKTDPGNDEHDDEHNDDHNHNHDHDRVDNVHAVKPASRPDSVSGSEFGSGSQQSVEGTETTDSAVFVVKTTLTSTTTTATATTSSAMETRRTTTKFEATSILSTNTTPASVDTTTSTAPTANLVSNRILSVITEAKRSLDDKESKAKPTEARRTAADVMRTNDKMPNKQQRRRKRDITVKISDIEGLDAKAVAESLVRNYLRRKMKEKHGEPDMHFRAINNEIIECGSEEWNGTEVRVKCTPFMDSRAVIEEVADTTTEKSEETVEPRDDRIYASPQCRVSSERFVSYYFILLFLLCFATPVLITTSLNVFITSAVRNTHHESISHHQWLTLAACVVMWGPCLTELLLSKWEVVQSPQPLSEFLFLLGHTHNLLRSILHAVFAQQMSSFARLGFFNNQIKVSWGKNKGSKVTPVAPNNVQKAQEFHKKMEIPIKRKDTLVPRPPAPGMAPSPPPPRRSTIPNIQVIETTCT